MVHEIKPGLFQETFGNGYQADSAISTGFIGVLTDLYDNPDLFDQVDFSRFELAELLAYLTCGHRQYLNYWLPKINQTVSRIQEVREGDQAAVLLIKAFMNHYQDELERHIHKEEKVLFGFARRLLLGQYDSHEKDMVLQHFLFTHNDDVILELDQLKAWLLENSKGLVGDMAFHILFIQLELFQNDLRIHGRIEDEVFIEKLLSYIDEYFEKLPGI